MVLQKEAALLLGGMVEGILALVSCRLLVMAGFMITATVHDKCT